jgi:hypothetical protein
MKHIHKGWAKPGDEIPQPIGLALGNNLRQNSRTDEFITEATNAGLTEDQARLFTQGRGSPYFLRGRVKRAWDTYRSRLSDLASAEEGFQSYANDVAEGHANFIPRAEKRLAKRRSPEEERAAGGSVYSLVPVNGNPFRQHGGQVLQINPLRQKLENWEDNAWDWFERAHVLGEDAFYEHILDMSPRTGAGLLGAGAAGAALLKGDRWQAEAGQEEQQRRALGEAIDQLRGVDPETTLMRQHGGNVPDEPPSGDPIGPAISRVPTLSIGVGPGFVGSQAPGAAPMPHKPPARPQT